MEHSISIVKDSECNSDPIRVLLQQPALPSYRIPVFRSLAARQEIELAVEYGVTAQLPNSEPNGFDATCHPQRQFTIGNQEFSWQPIQQWQRSVDVVVLSWAARNLALIPSILKARRLGIGVALWGHGYSKTPSATRGFIRNLLPRMADSIIFYDKNTAAHFTKLYPKLHAETFVATNTIDVLASYEARKTVESHPKQLSAFQSKNQLNPSSTILYVSRISRENRLDLLVRAAAILKNEFAALQVLIVGNGPADVEDELQALALELDVQDCIKFIGPIYDETELAKHFLSATVFCYPQNIGLSIIHAFAYGLPVITSNALERQNPEVSVLEDGVNGFLFDDTDVESLASKLRIVMSDNNLHQRMSNAAFATATELSIENMVDGLEAAIRCAKSERGRAT